MIKSIKIHNFGKIENLEIDCSNNRNVFILGQNGSGKTTILQAISLVLTGKVAKGITNDAYIGPKDKDFLIVLELDDGTKIGRTCKGAKLKLPSGAVYKKVKDVYEHLTFDPALLYNLSYVRQGEIADIFLSGNGKAVVDKLISLIIDSKRISEGNTELTRLSKQLDTELDYINSDIDRQRDLMNSIDYNSLINNIQKYQNEINSISNSSYTPSQIAHIESIHSRYDTVVALLKSQKDKYLELKQIADTVNKPEKTLAQLNKEKAAGDQYLIDSNEQLKLEALKGLFENSKQYSDLIDQYIRLKLPKNYSSEELESIRSINDTMLKYLTSEEYLDKISADALMHQYKETEDIDAESIIRTKRKLQECVEVLGPFKEVVKYVRSVNPEKSIDAISERIEELDLQIKEIKDKWGNPPKFPPMIFNADSTIEKAQDDWTKYNTAISMCERAKEDLGRTYSEYKALNAEIANYPSKEELLKIKDSANQIKYLENMIDMAKQQCALYESAKSKIDELIIQQKDIANKQSNIMHWKGIFNEIPNRLRQTLFNPVVAVLNKEFYELFSFSGLGEIKIDWSKVLITVGDKKFEQLSGAQMVAVGLSLRLALLKVMGECVPIMLVDEPTTFLDDDRKNDISKLLAHMGSASQCFVSTHDDNIIGSNSVIINLNK